jgi:hypothetical protein
MNDFKQHKKRIQLILASVVSVNATIFLLLAYIRNIAKSRVQLLCIFSVFVTHFSLLVMDFLSSINVDNN